MIHFQTNSINNIQAPMSFKAKSEEQNPVTKNDTEASSLDNPMETAGRSQVNFKGIKTLSAQELNNISRVATEMKLTGKEIKVGKQALIKTMNQYNCKSLKQFTDKINASLDAFNKGFVDSDDVVGYKMLNSFTENAKKIDADVNANRVTCIIDDYIAEKF